MKKEKKQKPQEIIQERHHRETRGHLQTSEAFKDTLLTQAPNPIIVYDVDKRIKYVNPAFEEMTGYSADEVLGLRSPFPWWPKQFADFYQQQQVDNSDTLPEDRERYYQKKDGTPFWVSSSLRHIVESGEVSMHVATWFNIDKRKAAEAALIESEAFGASLLEHAPNPVMVVNPDTSIRYINRALEKITGYDRKEVLGVKTPYPWWPKETTSEFERQPPQRNAGIENQEVRLTNKNGASIWITLSVRPIRENGQTKYAVGNWVDITERKRMEEILRESEEKYRLLVENNHDIIYTLTAEGAFAYVSPAWTTLLGHSTDQVIGSSFEEFVHPEDAQVCREFLDAVIKTRQPQGGVEYRVKHLDGSWRWHTSNAVFFKDKSGKIFYYGIAHDITERKEAEAALKESDAFKTSLLDDSPNPIIVTGAESQIIYVNPAMEKLTGYSNAELVGKNAPYPWWNKDRRSYSNPEDLKNGVNRHERQCKKKNGEPFWFSVTLKPIIEKGKIKFYIANCVDITEKKKIEEALIESEAFGASLLENAPNPVLVVNPDSSIRYVNSALEKLTGYSRDEILGIKTPYPWWPPEVYAGYEKGTESRTGEVISREAYFRRKDGSRFWVSYSIRQIKEAGKLKYSLGNWVDITQRKLAEEALKESESFKTSLLDDSPNPLLVTDAERQVIYINPAMERLTGFKNAELIGKKPPYPWWPENRVEQYQKEGDSLRDGTINSVERICSKKNGETFWISLSIRNIRKDGEIIYSITNWVDITQRKQMEERISELYDKEKKQREELQEEARARGLFINVLAHELRAPLTPIMASTSMLRDILQSRDEDILKRLVHNIYDSTEKLAIRLEELLDLARYDRGTFRLILQSVKLPDFLNAVITRFEPGLVKRRQHLEAFVAPDLASAEIDPSRLEQVIINLLSNASKYSADGSEIIFKATVEKSQLLVEIRDNGIGISPENQKQLFRPYHRVEQDRKQFPGLGLGLAVSKQIIDAHGGKIWVSSEPGQGSTFSFSIPLGPR